tara:strand:- start:292 stop:609 length:318 start_codon:yes stop_codon:yes gene_type:complete
MTKKNKTHLSRPYLDIDKNTLPASEYKSGKAVALLFALDFLEHYAEGSAVNILKQMENYLKKELKKLNVKIVVKTDVVDLSTAQLKDLDIRLNLNRENPLNEGTD